LPLSGGACAGSRTDVRVRSRADASDTRRYRGVSETDRRAALDSARHHRECHAEKATALLRLARVSLSCGLANTSAWTILNIAELSVGNSTRARQQGCNSHLPRKVAGPSSPRTLSIRCPRLALVCAPRMPVVLGPPERARGGEVSRQGPC